MRLNIAFDLDEVLVDVMSLFRQIVAERSYTTKDPLEYRLYDNPQFSNPIMSESTVSYFWSQVYEAYWRIKPHKGAVELLNMLHSETESPIKVVTNRPLYSASSTYYLMASLFKDIPFEIIFTDGHPKSIYLENFDFFVEDRRKTAIELTRNGKIVFVPQKSWNKINKFYPKIIDISDINELLSKITRNKHLYIID